jgi:hypothetical protein
MIENNRKFEILFFSNKYIVIKIKALTIASEIDFTYDLSRVKNIVFAKSNINFIHVEITNIIITVKRVFELTSVFNNEFQLIRTEVMLVNNNIDDIIEIKIKYVVLVISFAVILSLFTKAIDNLFLNPLPRPASIYISQEAMDVIVNQVP